MRNLGTVTNPVDIPRKQDIAAAGLNDLPANPSLYLNGNGAWTTPSLTGNNSWWETDVNGDLMPMLLPTGDPIEGANVILSENLTDHAIPRGNGGGSASKILQNSLALIDDNGSINIPSGQTYNINGSPHTHTEAQVTNLSTDLAAKAPLASPTFTGTPAAPTAAAGTNTTQLATTAFVVGQASAINPLGAGIASVGTSTKFSREDHVHPLSPLTGSLDAGNYSINHVKTLLMDSLFDNGNSGTSKVINWNAGGMQKLLLTDNVTVAFTGSPTWTQKGTSQSWYCIASSSDGVKLVAATYGGYLHVSSDSGATWAQKGTAQYWRAVASSSDGVNLVAVAEGNYVYTSSDSGATWTQRATSQAWRTVTSSLDGSKLAAAVDGGYIYTSSDSGATWTQRATSQAWRSIASSSNGTKLVAVADSNYIYTSSDSGITWAQRATSQAWLSAASSSDGVKLIAATNGGYLYVSSDSGVTWTQKATPLAWLGVASSSDGVRLAAITSDGYAYTSSDSGETWMQRAAPQSWWCAIACSSDGMKLAAVAYGSYVYTIDISSDIYLPSAPCLLALKVIQDATGSHTVAWPLNVTGPMTINPSPNGETYILFFFDGTDFNTINPSSLTETTLATGFAIAGGTTNKTLTVDADITASTLATTAFVTNQAGTATPLMEGTAAVGTSTKFAREDHVHPTDTSRAAATHTHAATDVTSGQLALAYGGTGAATAVAARTNLKALGNGVYYSLATSGSITIDWNNGCTQGPSAAMTAAITLATPSNPVNPEVYRLKFSCGATAYQVTWWSSGVVPKWAGGTAPTFAANKTYIITLLYDGTYYYASSVEF